MELLESWKSDSFEKSSKFPEILGWWIPGNSQWPWL